MRAAIALLLLLLLPFLVITWFNNPSIDDYAFVYYTKTLGLWGAQVMWYTQWTGRYTGMFLMSLHPMLLDSLLLYKVISAVIILLSWHAMYRFVGGVFEIRNRPAAIVLSLMALYVYANGMPTLVQGFYWEAGAITYQLGNVLILHWIVNVYKAGQSANGKTGILKDMLNVAIIFVACGLSETIMLTMLLAAALFFAWKIWNEKRLDKSSSIYLLVALACSAVVYFAPGNFIRGDIGGDSANSGNAFHAIFYSLKAGVIHAFKWIFTVEWMLFTGAFVATLSIYNPKWARKISWPFVAMAILIGGGVVSATFTPGFYATGVIPPERVVNVSYWTFLVVWMGCFGLIASQYAQHIRHLFQNRSATIFLSVVLLLCASIDKADNVYAAWSDLLSGRAARHNAEFLEREALVKSCAESTCVIPSFTVFPKSVFNEDMANYFDRSNLVWYAHYHQKDHIEGVFKAPEEGFNRYFDFEGGHTDLLGNQATITDSMAASGFKSSFVQAGEGFSASFRTKMSEMDVRNIFFLGRVQVTAKVYTTDANCDADLVFVLNKPGKSEPLVWRGGPVTCDSSQTGMWQEVKLLLPLEKRFIHPKHEIVVYLWNHGASDVYLDDLDIWIY